MRALVTGGTHGIGKAIADTLKKKHEVITIARYSGEVKLDVTGDLSGIIRIIGDIDILINNVGGGGRWGNTFLDTDYRVWEEVYDKNAGAAINFTRCCLPHMLGQNWGRVITISSICGIDGNSSPWYCVAKSAEIMLMKTLARYYRGSGITFNSIAPGGIRIPDKENVEGKLGEPEDVANLVDFLTEASHINGACIVIDGG